MSEYGFRPAVRENVGLFIGLAGGTGSGKTMSAMKMAKGIVGPGGRFAVIDTENRRASHYAEMFDFDVLDLAAPFSPARYEEAVVVASRAGYKAIVLDSGSHEHDGHGGYLDMQAEDLAERVERAMKKNPNLKEWDAIDRLTPLSWQRAKKERKRMLQTMLACSTSIPIIFCFRAEEKVFSNKDGKLVANNPPIWAPVCGKGMPFEMTVFFMLHRENPGVPTPIKLQAQHKALFPLDKPLDEATGRAIATWAAGSASGPATATPTPSAVADTSSSTPGTDDGLISVDQVTHLEDECKRHGIPVARLCAAAKVSGVKFIGKKDYQRAVDWIARKSEPQDANTGAPSGQQESASRGHGG